MKKAQIKIFGFMFGILMIILALALAFPVKEMADTARNASNLDCGNTSISIFDKATCVVADTSIFMFVGGLVFIGGALITAKMITSK